jgi:hypothetical protein
MKMIEYHFQFRYTDSTSSGTSTAIVKTAKAFFAALIYQPITGMVSISIGRSYPYCLVDSILVPSAKSSAEYRNEYDYAKHSDPTNSGNNGDDGDRSWRGLAKRFNLEDENNEHCKRNLWRKMLQVKSFVPLLSASDSDSDSDSKTDKLVSLSAADVQFIIHLLIDAEHDLKETFEKIASLSEISETDPANLTSQFPTADDDFSSFDPIRLRGVLAETVLSRKLLGYALGQEEIYAKNAGSFASIAPAALTAIVSSYYPVNVPHPSSLK